MDHFCVACHEVFKNHEKPNLPYSRYLCPDCVDSIGCYVCNGKRPSEDDELMLCDNCGWRGAHFRCLGYRGPPKTWFCFQCEDPKVRDSQSRAFPIIDARVHDDFLAYAARKRSESNSNIKKRPAVDEEEELRNVTPGNAVDGLVLKKKALGVAERPLLRALGKVGLLNPDVAAKLALDSLSASAPAAVEKAEQQNDAAVTGAAGAAGAATAVSSAGGASASSPAQPPSIKCFRCDSSVTQKGLNYCPSCGGLLSVKQDFLDHVMFKRRSIPTYLCSNGYGQQKRLVDGTIQLLQIRSSNGRDMVLLISADQKEMYWMIKAETP